ncbi:ATP-binding protein [Streptomyces bauhiniae]|uniref:ATP-binding protein n=1 Tax=Streptomyces bauhiniae TaxID=2340725 RepID=A0A7K3QMM6_9ACTN|nr:ATP-binding protein [Streptomyces bauhiniae]NEB91145.1 ATP-binding protein [Streptomyces bauhiniae]
MSERTTHKCSGARLERTWSFAAKTAPGRQVEVILDHSAGRFRVEVRDTGEGMPRRRPEVPLAVSGRGLEIVDALCEKWGIAEQVVGKTVWAELVVNPSEAVDDR